MRDYSNNVAQSQENSSLVINDLDLLADLDLVTDLSLKPVSVHTTLNSRLLDSQFIVARKKVNFFLL